MRKLLLVAVLGFGVAGCQTVPDFSKSVLQGGASIVTPIQNPIGRKELYALENSFTVAVAAGVAYRRACVRGLVPVSCRDHIVRAQEYTRRIPPLLVQLRRFVRENNQISAITIFQEVKGLIFGFEQTLAVAKAEAK